MLAFRGKLTSTLKTVFVTITCGTVLISCSMKLIRVPERFSEESALRSFHGFFKNEYGPQSSWSQALEIATTSDSVSAAQVGQKITYSYVVTNTGSNSVTDIKVKSATNGTGQRSKVYEERITVDVTPLGDSFDTVPHDGVWTSLGKGDSVLFESIYVVSQHDVDTLQNP
jgi:hypothetical protein